MNKRFWMIWSPEGRAPTRQHLTLDEARKEADRLANQAHNDGPFYILQAIERVQIIKRPVETTVLSDEPFTPEERREHGDDGIPF